MKDHSKIALISWSIKNRTPEKGYINLGEIYDKDLKMDQRKLREFHEELYYLYPFRCLIEKEKITCFNTEDIAYFQKKFKLTVRIKTENIPGKQIVTFRSPILYNLDTMKPLFPKIRKRFDYSKENEYICVVRPTLNPVIRGKLLEECLSLRSKNLVFILANDVKNTNTESIATLMTRFLLKNSIGKERIVKLNDLDINTFLYQENVVIACENSTITELAEKVRKYRQSKNLQQRITFLTNMY